MSKTGPSWSSCFWQDEYSSRFVPFGTAYLGGIRFLSKPFPASSTCPSWKKMLANFQKAINLLYLQFCCCYRHTWQGGLLIWLLNIKHHDNLSVTRIYLKNYFQKLPCFSNILMNFPASYDSFMIPNNIWIEAVS